MCRCSVTLNPKCRERKSMDSYVPESDFFLLDSTLNSQKMVK